jgi:signal transduction histidine kinase
MGNVIKTFVIRNDSLTLLTTKELEEDDFREVKENSYFLQIVNCDGKYLIKSENLAGINAIPFDLSINRNSYSFYNITYGEDELRTGYYRFVSASEKTVAHMQLSVFRTGMSSIVRDIIAFNLLSLPILFVIIIFASILLVKRTLSPINEIIHTAGKISAQNLNERIKYEADSSDEIGRLRDTLNNLFERLEFQVHQISQFTDHASHQLMNPLTIIKSELDFALRKERNSEDYKNSLVLLSEQTEKMIKIINQLLIISKHENEPSSRKSLFNLSKLIIEDISRVFKNVNLSYQIEPDIYLRGSSEIFSIVIENLIDNALKYSISDPEIKITVKKTKDKIEVIVSDNGIGIENQDKDKVFERFFRTGKAEEIGIKGFGLGLTVVKSILTQMNGSISVEDNIPQGSKFIVRLPTVNIE